MDTTIEGEVRDLAYHMWKSANNEFGRAVDFWVMAEQMVVELAAASMRFAGAATRSATTTLGSGPATVSAVYVYRVHELAHCMWQAAGEHYERSMDFWLAAERHVAAMMQAAARSAGSTVGGEAAVVRAFEQFNASAYLDQVRRTAYFMWEKAGRQYGRNLEFWLAAEQQVRDGLFGSANGKVPAAEMPAAVQLDSAPQPSGESNPPASRGKSAQGRQSGAAGRSRRATTKPH